MVVITFYQHGINGIFPKYRYIAETSEVKHNTIGDKPKPIYRFRKNMSATYSNYWMSQPIMECLTKGNGH